MTSFTGTPRECLADLSDGSRFHELTAEGGAAFYFFLCFLRSLRSHVLGRGLDGRLPASLQKGLLVRVGYLISDLTSNARDREVFR